MLAVEEDLLDCNRVVQIGLRGSGFAADWDVPRKMVCIHEIVFLFVIFCQ